MADLKKGSISSSGNTSVQSSSGVDKHKMWSIIGVVFAVLVIGLLVGYPLLSGKKMAAAGQAIAKGSGQCVEGKWYLASAQGDILASFKGPFEGCVKTAEGEGAFAWCPTKTDDEEYQVYVSGGKPDVDYKYCDVSCVTHEECGEGGWCTNDCSEKYSSYSQCEYKAKQNEGKEICTKGAKIFEGTSACASGKWYYQKSGGGIAGPFTGCTTEDDTQYWCAVADSPALKKEYSVYHEKGNINYAPDVMVCKSFEEAVKAAVGVTDTDCATEGEMYYESGIITHVCASGKWVSLANWNIDVVGPAPNVEGGEEEKGEEKVQKATKDGDGSVSVGMGLRETAGISVDESKKSVESEESGTVPIVSCSDSDAKADGSIDLMTAGETKLGEEVKTDLCVGISVEGIAAVKEFYCAKQTDGSYKIGEQELDCPSGYYCGNGIGACVKIKGECSDSDGGGDQKQYLTKGTVTLMKEGKTETKTDTCVDAKDSETEVLESTTLKDYFCFIDAGEYAIDTDVVDASICGKGMVCKDGACVEQLLLGLGSACSVSKECVIGLVCEGGTCLGAENYKGCELAKDCASGLECKGQVCGKKVIGLKGDVNCDSKINNKDYILTNQYVLSAKAFSCADGMANADVNCDGKVNNKDAILINKKVLETLKEFVKADGSVCV